ncbi:MAG: nucleotidyltransferase family protein [Sulfolobales archaeon]
MAESMKVALLLAAGASRRFGENKLLYRIRDSELGEDHMVRITTKKFLEAGVFDEIVVVVGFEHSRIIEVLADLDVKFVYNPSYSLGMSSSVIAGIKRVVKYSKLVAVHPSDVPFIKTRTLRYLVDSLPVTYRANCILIPSYQGRGGHPVLLIGDMIKEALSIKEEERGLKGLISRYREYVQYLDVNDPGVIMDIDNPEDIRKAETLRQADTT